MTHHNFTPGGRTHVILKRLSRSSCKAGFLFRALGWPEKIPIYQRKKFWRLMDYLKEHGLVDQREDGVIDILSAGMVELDKLDAQTEAPVQGQPTVRIFDPAGHQIRTAHQ